MNRDINSDNTSQILSLLARGVEMEDIKSYMSGDDAVSIIENISENPLFPYYKKLFQKNDKLFALMHLDYFFKEQLGIYKDVPVHDNLDPNTFFDRYFYENRPVLVKNWANNWPAMNRWNFNFFKKHYGNEIVEITSGRDSDELYEIEMENFKRKITLRDYLELIESNPESNDVYLVARNFLLANPAFAGLFEDFSPIDQVIDPNAHNDKGYVKMWIGPKGTITPLHHDRVNVLLVQVMGRKLVRFIPPNQNEKVYNERDVFSELDLNKEIDFNKFPLAKNLKIIDVVVHPGEALLIPVGWWHWVKSLDVSITLTHQEFCIPDGNILLVDDFE
jgi:ribosomal protein L16 Arg81 hydroxylase